LFRPVAVMGARLSDFSPAGKGRSALRGFPPAPASCLPSAKRLARRGRELAAG